MECWLSASVGTGIWSCQVSIRWEFDVNGTRLGTVTEEPFGGIILQREEVEIALRRAQVAVLNPQLPSDGFHHLTTQDLKKYSNNLAFSRNVVCLDISGPDLTDLSFVDLPGTF